MSAKECVVCDSAMTTLRGFQPGRRGRSRRGLPLNPLRLLSLGAGVQSSTLAMMCATGVFPKIDAAIFADTGSEPKAVYEHLDRLTQLISKAPNPFPVHIVRANRHDGKLINQLNKEIDNQEFVTFPAWIISEGRGTPAKWSRGCTLNYKLKPILRKTRELLGRKRMTKRDPVLVNQLIGISLDEAHRMKPCREHWVESTYPLVEARITRRKCLEWWKVNVGGALPPRSSCTFCPYKTRAEWVELKLSEPEAFAEAVSMDERLAKPERPDHFKKWLPKRLHYSGRPLTEVVATDFSDAQPDLFGNECEGMCGV